MFNYLMLVPRPVNGSGYSIRAIVSSRASCSERSVTISHHVPFHAFHLRHTKRNAVPAQLLPPGTWWSSDSPVLCIPNELDVGSTTELAPPPARRVTLHGKRSSMAWVPSPAMVSATSLSHYGRPQDETWITSIYRGLRTVGTDGVATVVATLALCFFIGLAIWSMSAVQDQWDGDGLDSAEDADARLHVELYGGEPSSPLARVHDKIPKIDWKITVATRGLRSSKSSLKTTELPTMALTNPAIVLSAGDVEGPEDPVADGDESHESVERDDDDDSVARLTSTALDTTVTVGSKRVHITRRQRPSKKHRHSAKHTKPQNQRASSFCPKFSSTAVREGFVEGYFPLATVFCRKGGRVVEPTV
ncbi:hypothetical protein MRX96_026236 [Rhipicephalus microplus]